MSKEAYIEVQEAMATVTPKGEWVNLALKREGDVVSMTVKSQESDFKIGMRNYPCGASQECQKEISEGISCASGCEYHKNYLMAKGVKSESDSDVG